MVAIPKSVFSRAADLADQYWPHVLSIVGGIAMGYCGSGNFPADYPGTRFWTFWIGATVFLMGSVSSVQRSAAIVTLRARLNDLEGEAEQFRGDYFARFDSFLRITAEALGNGRTERITIYRYKQGRFMAVGRYSGNLAYCERRRPYYPVTQGCIGRAWKEGSAFEGCLPNPKTDLDKYLAAQKDRWGLQSDEVRSFNMKSRSLAAYVINDLAGNQRLGVVVFESERGNGLQKSALASILPTEGRRIAHLIETLAAFEPDPDAAKRQGF